MILVIYNKETGEIITQRELPASAKVATKQPHFIVQKESEIDSELSKLGFGTLIAETLERAELLDSIDRNTTLPELRNLEKAPRMTPEAKEYMTRELAKQPLVEINEASPD